MRAPDFIKLNLCKLNLEATAGKPEGWKLAIRPIQGFSKEQLDGIALFFEHLHPAEDIHEKAKALVWGLR